jgi:uncharacterized SAM-binding protein YcdF (DUF218 family)
VVIVPSHRPKDAIVVLGCRLGPDGRVFGAALRRAQRAAQAYREGLAPMILVSGGTRWGGRSEADGFAQFLFDQGIPKRDVLLEARSQTTRENAQQATALLAPRGACRVVVVTCDFHMPRALAQFTANGLDCVGLAATTPPGTGLRKLVRLAREVVARAPAHRFYGYRGKKSKQALGRGG